MGKRGKNPEAWRGDPELIERACRCFEAGVNGLGFREIGAAEDFSHETARLWYARGRTLVNEAAAAPVDDLRAEQVAMALDCYQAAWAKRDLRAALDALKHIAKLTGTEAPTKLAGHDGGPLDLAAGLERLIARRRDGGDGTA